MLVRVYIKKRMTIDFISFAYAATVATGGIIGYARAGKINIS